MHQSHPQVMNARFFTRLLLIGQGVYYLVTGIWPLVNESSFKQVTGPKTDFWLVKTAGLLIGVLGGALLLAAGRQRLTPEVVLAGVGTAVSLGSIDAVYTSRKRIPKIYLLDALAQVAFLAGWVRAALWLRSENRAAGG